ncbi:Rubrerythrin [Kosmotoga arenicorallina S304]|uniref:Rubrerythrin n=1 Tax=Kosmotoga arenicorallina S304 TaxID=1453497 RepID=A0A176JXG1_9BACT|nr:ferritin family protein [Kosmotoga arenicorallina]OAA28417.1 Rubrerythrin [Kosmotoga arenicorallina S304]
MEKIRKILEVALNFEKSGQDFYRMNMEKVNQKLAKEIFKYLMNMEASHVKYIQSLIDELKDGKPLLQLQDYSDEMFEKRLQSQALSESTYKSDLADLSIFRMAYLIEKDFVEYYEKAAEKVEDESSKALFITLRDWEKRHAEMIKSLMEKIFEKHSLDLGFYG